MRRFLHHDNASADTSMFVRQFLAKNKIVIMLQPAYSPMLATADYFLFPKLKTLAWDSKHYLLDHGDSTVTGSKLEHFKNIN